MQTSAAISVKGLGKTYRIAQRQDRPTTAAEALLWRLRHPRASGSYREFNALEDVSFDVSWGQALGIIGRNGAGKSTLLKVLTRIAAPSSGRIRLAGRIGSLLEIGTGFHPELTGRENVYLNGTLLGMRRREIQRRFDEIVDFSGVEKFLETPVKRYSSGMYIRLAFAVAAHLETEILAVDEVLAVGDADFQSKCLRKMREVAQSGRTVLLVSHQIQTVTALCTSALYLERGRVLMHGSVEAAFEQYKRSFERAAAEVIEPARRPGSGELRFSDVRVVKDTYMPDDEKVVEFVVPAKRSFVGSYYVSCHINDPDGIVVAQCDSRLVGFWCDAGRETHGRLSIRSPWLKPGSYTVDLYLCKTGVLDAWEGACMFEVLPILPYPEATGADGTGRGVVLGDFSYDQ
ncbi:MAG: ABC transporter ATP-binding protein [Mycobacterium sp.]|nr:ABC transporter ATP-binding protein [Mycobacterium sp.]